MTIYLASKSPRRKELLTLIEKEFQILDVSVDETADDFLSPEDQIKQISRKKAEAAKGLVSAEDIVISADTAVVSGNEILGKPKSEIDAEKMLLSLSGKTHTVITAVTVLKGEKSITRAVKTNITFRELSKSEISEYVLTGEPMDKAGAYGIQAGAAKFVSRIEGDYFATVGLPVCETHLMLEEIKKSF